MKDKKVNNFILILITLLTAVGVFFVSNWIINQKNVKDNDKDLELLFNTSEIELKIGEKNNITLTNSNGSHKCTANSDLIKITESADGCSFEALKEGTTIITATEGNRTATTTIKIINPIVEVNNITFSKNAIRLSKGETYTLEAKISPENAINKTISYTSKNSSTAEVSNGIVTALEYGTTTIEATTNNGKKATISIIVTGKELLDSYESDSLKYWIEKRSANYAITNIWVEDAYSQFKMAITSPKKSDSPIPRNPEKANIIIQNEITNKGYQSKGLVAINASAMVSSSYGKGTPSSWFGTSQIPLILYEGQVIRNSSDQTIRTDDDYIIYGLKKNGELTYYNYTKGNNDQEKNENAKIMNTIINDGVLYTFGFKPVLVSNGTVATTSNSTNIRQAICQVDNNNFIFITNTNSTSNRNLGFSFVDLAETFKKLNCITALNLDGGGSTCEFYKDNTDNLKKLSTAYGSRELSDMIYFVEK